MNAKKATPVQILRRKGDTYEVDSTALGNILLQEEIQDRSAVVIAIVGDHRKGKSFLLGYFLRYLKYKYASKEQPDSAYHDATWMGNDSEPLEGFTWAYGSKHHTKGIMIWSEVFLTTLEGDEKVGILLMDSQGAFDPDSSFRQSATVFSLCAMTSSCLCYNVSKNIQENDINNLQLFADYGRLAMESNRIKRKPFQRLVFVIRDWEYPGEESFGESGGRRILEERLAIKKGMQSEQQVVRESLNSCFVDIGCFLMPHPGNVIEDFRYNGNLGGLQPDFRLHLCKLVPFILSPKRLVVKEIAGKTVKIRDLMQYFESFAKVLASDKIPEPKSLYFATAEANNLSAVNDALVTYRKMMNDEVFQGSNKYVEPAVVEVNHERIKKISIDQFRAAGKMGGDDMNAIYEQRIHKELEILHRKYVRANRDNKQTFWKTPALYFGTVVTFYILSSIFTRLGMRKLAETSRIAVQVTLISFITWSYVLYRKW